MKFSEIKDIKKGDILHDSWGYDMTINVYCKVLENNGKTIKCQKIGKKRVGESTDAMVYSVMPDTSKNICKPFRIKISKSIPNINDPKGENGYLVGSYPYLDRAEGESCKEKQKGFWSRWSGRPDGENHAD